MNQSPATSPAERQAYARQSRLPACPFCKARAGQPCRNRLGEVLGGPHYQRQTTQRAAIRAAMYLYAPLEPAVIRQLSAASLLEAAHSGRA